MPSLHIAAHLIRRTMGSRRGLIHECFASRYNTVRFSRIVCSHERG